MAECLLVVFTLALVIATIFLAYYTYQLGKVSIFDKRYKIYESLINLFKKIKTFENGKVTNLFLDKLRKHIKNNEANAYDIYNNSYGEIFNEFTYQIEGAHFLFDEQIYRDLKEIEVYAEHISKYLYDVLISTFEDENSANFNDAIKFFSDPSSWQKITYKFIPYLKIGLSVKKS